VLGLQRTRPARRRNDDHQTLHPDHDRRRRRRRAAGARILPHVRVRDGQHAPQVLGQQLLRPAWRWHDDRSHHPDHDRRRRRRRAAGARKLPHVRIRDERYAPQVLGLQQLRPARRRHDVRSHHPNHDQRRRRRRAAGARRLPHVRVRDEQRAPQVLGLQQLRPARRRHEDRSHQLNLVPRARPSTTLAAPTLAAALAPRPHPRPHDHLCQRRRRHHPLRQRADRWRDVRLPPLGQCHVRGRRGRAALPDRRRALEPLAPRAPRRPDDLQALRRAGRLARQPRRSLHLRELRTALCCILALFGLATAQPSAKRLAAIRLTSRHPTRAIPAPPTAALALTSRTLSPTIAETAVSAAAALAAAEAVVFAAVVAAASTTASATLAAAALATASAHKPVCPAGARILPHVRVRDEQRAPQVLGLQRLRPARRRHDVRTLRPDHDRRRRRRRAAGARRLPHVRVRDGQCAPQVLGRQQLRPARRRHDDRSLYPDHDQRRRRRRAAGARILPHVRIRDEQHAPQVLGLQRQWPARRRHDNHSQHPDHDRRRRRRRAAGARRIPHVRIRDEQHAPQVLGRQLQRPARRRHDDPSQHPDLDQHWRRRRAAGARILPHVRIRDEQHAPQVLGLQRKRPARRRHDDPSHHPDHNQRRRRRRAAGARRLPHVRIRDEQRAPQVLGLERLRPARRRHDDRSHHPDHDRRRRRRRAAGARRLPHVRIRDERHAPQVLGLQQQRPARRRHDDRPHQPQLVPRARPSTTFAATTLAATFAPRCHPRPRNHLHQRPHDHHLRRQRGDRRQDVRLSSRRRRHVRGRRGPRALPDRRRDLEQLAHPAPWRPDDLQALRRAGRLARQPRRSLHLRELRTAHRCDLAGAIAAAAVATAVAAASTTFSIAIALAHYVATTAAIPLTITAASSMQPTRAAPASTAAALTYAS
jgi:hypothetical protein